MAVFKCKICGGTLEININQSVATCEYCGTKQTLPKLDDERKANLYDRANHFRRNNDFDKAMSIYEQILNEDNTDAESYWSILLCRYGIEYVEDPATHKRVPTVNRAQYTSVFDDEDYKSALQYADGFQREIYQSEAAAINEIQKGILAISQKEEPFDVFICYKETDNSGRRTKDSVLATELYHELTKEGYKVFFSRITLEDKLGVAYEPYIFAALNSAKVMVVLGTRPEHFNAVWVKNEWSRYLALIKNGAKKTLIPAYRDMDPYDLPEEFSHLQAQDMSKLGFMQDLTRGIKKIIETDDKPTFKETIVQANSTINIAPLLKRAFMFLEDGDFERADDFCEQVLNQDPENSEAYLGKLMAELHVKRQEDLADCAEPFDENKNYQKAVRFGDTSFSAIMKGYNSSIKERNARKAEEARKKSLYLKAIDNYNSADVLRIQDAINAFSSLNGYEDSNEYIRLCQSRIAQIHIHEEKYRQEQERLAEEKRIAEEQTRLERQRQAEIDHVKAEKRAKRNKKIAIIVSPIIAVVIAFIIILNSVIIPNNKYNNAVALYNKQNYLEAAEIFYDVWEYKDSNEYYKKCYQKYYKNDSLIVSNSKEMPYLIVNNGYVRRKENATIPSKIIIPDLFDGVYICKIETEAFEDCGSIEYVQISSNIEIIGERAFSWCSNLKDIKLSEGLTQIGADAFSFTAIDSIYIPQSVNSIGSGILHGTEMNSIEVDQKNINYRSSGNCLIDIINKEIIAGCKNSIIPSDGSVNIISYDAFGFCDGLTKIIISNGINTLDRFCFSGSHDLVEITLPTTIQKIGHASFYLCDQLTTINFVGTKSQWYEIEKDDDWDLLRSDSETGTRSKGKYLIHCTDGTISN